MRVIAALAIAAAVLVQSPAQCLELCCWAPKGKETRCLPCRPTREAHTP